MEYMTRPGDDSTHLYVGPFEEPNRYQLGKTIGVGAEGEVVRASIFSQGAWRSELAIKVLHSGSTDGSEFDRRYAEWLEQLNLVQALAHQGVVRMRSLIVGPPPHYADEPVRPGRSLYLVMNWAPGHALSDWLVSNSSASYSPRASIVKQIGAALGYLHSGKDTGGTAVLHGDLKPGNVIVGPDGSIQIVDFGLSRSETFQARTGVSGGFAAPELRERAPISKASDIYALGATAFTLFAGSNPPEFTPANYDAQLLRSMLVSSPLVGRNPQIVDHVLWAMAATPEQRPASASEWAKELSTKTTVYNGPLAPPAPGSVDGRGHSVAPPTSTPPAARGGTRVLVAALVVLLLPAAGLWYGVARNLNEVGSGNVAAGSVPTTETQPASTTAPSTSTSTTRPKTTSTSTSTSTTTTTSTTPQTTVPQKHYVGGDGPHPELVQGGLKGDSVDISGTTYPRSLYANDFGCMTNRTVSSEYNLGRKAKSFHSVAGVTDIALADSVLRFRVLADGQEVFNGVGAIGEGLMIDVDVTDVLRLTLEISYVSGHDGCSLGSPKDYGAFGDPSYS